MTNVLLILSFFAVTLSIGDPMETKIVFRSGGSMVGEIVSETKESGRSYVVIRTKSGSVIKLDKAKIIHRIQQPDAEDKSYQEQLAKLDDSSQAHWQMYEWCKKTDKSKFRDRMRFHLKEIVRLDPDDAAAWNRLGDFGEPYVKVGNKWVPEEQHYMTRGYVRDKGRWVPKVLLAEKQRQGAAEELLGDRKKAFKNFKKNVLTKKEPAVVRKELERIADPLTLPTLEKELTGNISPRTRILYLEAIGRIKSRHAQRVLVKFAVEDPVYEVREVAMLQLESDTFSKASTIGAFSEYLTPPLPRNSLVNQAASLIGRLDDEAGIVPLVNALRTTHRVKTNTDPGRVNAGFGSGGTSFNTGGNGPKFVDQMRDNEGVRQALYDITGRDLGFDAAVWRRWYISEHTVVDYNVREDSDD